MKLVFLARRARTGSLAFKISLLREFKISLLREE
jgi:hypothetical protein